MNAPAKTVKLAAVLLMTFVAAGCENVGDIRSGPPQTETRSVPLGNAKLVRVKIEMGAGELQLTSGAKDLLDADFTYSDSRSRPEVDYSVSAGEGSLTVRQPSGSSGPHGHYRWDMRLNNQVPMQLEVHLGAGKSRLILGSLALSNVSLDMGVGESLVDLTGGWKKDLEARIHGGVGKLTLRLPNDTGVRVNAHGGIGAINRGGLKQEGDTYTNDAYGKTPATLRVSVEGGIGEINLELAEAPPVI